MMAETREATSLVKTIYEGWCHKNIGARVPGNNGAIKPTVDNVYLKVR